MNVINFSLPVPGSFLIKLILGLVTATGSVALGVILFTVLLKVITLPFDIISRKSMRKNSLLMEQMRPDLERLQKQYSNNKELYNQKMMALYKKNGYSMWGSCLPTILTLIIFIVAINGFTGYSQYQNRVYFYEMTKAYNSVIYEGFEKDGSIIAVDEEGNLNINDKTLYTELKNEIKEEIAPLNASHKIYSFHKHEDKGVIITTQNGFIRYTVSSDEEKFELLNDKLFTEEVYNKSSDNFKFGFEIDDKYITLNPTEKKIDFNVNELYKEATKDGGDHAEISLEGYDHKIIVDYSNYTITVSTTNGYVSYISGFTLENGEVTVTKEEYKLITENFFNNQKTIEKENASFCYGMEIDGEYIKIAEDKKSIQIDVDKLNNETTIKKPINGEKGDFEIFYALTEKGYTLFTTNGYMQYYKEVSENAISDDAWDGEVSYGVIEKNLTGSLKTEANNKLLNENGQAFNPAEVTAEDFIRDIQSIMSAKTFSADGFLWVKNIWVTDGAHKHPIPNYEEFKATVADTSGCGCSCSAETTAPISEQEYNLLTAKLVEEKTMANGFYILCILSALISLASQIITTRSQKAQLELQTVDGQGASSQKMMTWMMPIMMAFFSFMYTAAFSIYIIINTALSIVTTVVINKVVEKKFGETKKSTNVVRGRVYVKKEEPKENEKNKNKAKAKVKEEKKTEDTGFLTGLSDGKQPTKKAKKKK